MNLKCISRTYTLYPKNVPRRNLLGHKRQGVYYQDSRQKMRLLDFLVLEICLFCMREFLDRNPR